MRLLITALVALAPAIALADPLVMTAATHGSTLDLTFTNTTFKPVTMTTHVRAGRDHFDWLTVKLTSKATRTLHFIETRTKAVPVEATIAPGKSVSVHVDLALWAIHGDNGGEPLAADTYTVEATWKATTPKLDLVATTKLAVPAAKETSCKDSSTTGLELLARQVGQGTNKTPVLEVGVHNVDSVAHCIHGIIKTHETQSDWMRVDFGDKERALRFDDDRDKSYPLAIELPPGATYWTKWNLVEWAKRPRNGAKAPASGTVSMDVTFDATRERIVWRGAIKTALGFVFP